MIGVILLGKSNSGKSTIGKNVALTMDMIYISSGDIARSMSDNKAKEDLDAGKFAPEDEMRKLVLAKINESNKSYILDGFPRFYDQYEWLNQAISHDLIYVFVDADDNVVIRRAQSRGRCDDNSIMNKLEFYKKNTLPMIEEIISTGQETVYTVNNDTESSEMLSANVLEICRFIGGYEYRC